MRRSSASCNSDLVSMRSAFLVPISPGDVTSRCCFEGNTTIVFGCGVRFFDSDNCLAGLRFSVGNKTYMPQKLYDISVRDPVETL